MVSYFLIPFTWWCFNNFPLPLSSFFNLIANVLPWTIMHEHFFHNFHIICFYPGVPMDVFLLFHIYKAIDISLLLVSPYLLPWPISVPHHHNIDISLKNIPTIMHFISKLISVTSIPPVPRHHFLFTESSLPNFTLSHPQPRSGGKCCRSSSSSCPGIVFRPHEKW